MSTSLPAVGSVRRSEDVYVITGRSAPPSLLVSGDGLHYPSVTRQLSRNASHLPRLTTPLRRHRPETKAFHDSACVYLRTDDQRSLVVLNSCEDALSPKSSGAQTGAICVRLQYVIARGCCAVRVHQRADTHTQMGTHLHKWKQL